jgi:hypothetical protein
MEVHHHSGLHKKSWKGYFLEFLMIFLAVTMGFFAEQIRESYVERHREKEFMVSMLADIKSDTANLNQMIRGFTQLNIHIDSLTPLLLEFNKYDDNATKIYLHQVHLNDYFKWTYTDRTIEQLKNSGNFRLIRNKIISDNIIDYDSWVRNYVGYLQDVYVLNLNEKIHDASENIFKFSVTKNWVIEGKEYHQINLPTKPYFLSTEKTVINKFINLLDEYSLSIKLFTSQLNVAVEKAKKLDALIRVKYHL